MQKKHLQKGNVMLILTLFITLTGTAMIVTSSKSFGRDARETLNLSRTKQSFVVAESGFEDVLTRLKTGKQVGSTEILTIGDSTATTDINTVGSNLKEVISSGLFRDNTRIISTRLTTTVGMSFSYGMQSGQGGLTMSNNSGIVGNVYTNGSIIGSGGAYITGSAIAANGDAASSDQSNGGTSPVVDTTFGTTNSNQDVAQSFILAASNNLAKVQFYIKKVGSPSSATVTIRNNSGGSPGSTIIATGTLNSSLVSTSYGYIDVTFTTSPSLTMGTTYWLTIDVASNNTSNYYIIGGDSLYTNGTAKTGRTGSTWAQIGTNTDLYFGVFTGGALGSISNVTIGTAGAGNAHANTVTGSTIAGTLYCQTGSSNNKTCNTTLADPVPQPFPISDGNINDWKAIALAGGTTSGSVSISGTQTLNAQKITGNLTVANGATLIMNGILWVEGNVNVNNNGLVKVPASYGANGGIIVVDGTISLSNNARFAGSGTTGSYIMAITTSTSATAISVANNGGSVILYAPNGTAVLSNNAGANQITAYKITLGNNSVVTYDSGLVNANFSTGPSGTWQLGSWSESN